MGQGGRIKPDLGHPEEEFFRDANKLSRFIPVAIVAGFLTAVPSAVWADTITFDLETQATGTFTSISNTQSGLTLTVHRQDNGNFTIENVGTPPAFGTRQIGNF